MAGDVNIAALPTLITSTVAEGNHYLTASVSQQDKAQQSASIEQVRRDVRSDSVVAQLVNEVA